MEGFSWKKEYELGLEKFDKQYMLLVDFFDKLMRAYDNAEVSNMEEILDSLKNYVFIHFKYEELLFDKHNWDTEELNHH